MAKKTTYLLGIDAGNTVVKAVLFDTKGHQLASSGLDAATIKPSPGYVERDLDELWANTVRVIRTCLDESGIDATQIAAIGCAGHGNGLYALDHDDAPLLAIQSLDTRATALAAELKERVGLQLYQICRQQPWPAQTATLLAWVHQKAPEIFARIGSVFLCKDFISFLLTGRKVSDISDMTGAGLANMATGQSDADLMRLYGLDGAQALLPPIVQPTEHIGGISAAAAKATGLAVGTPVVGGLFDVVASAVGSGATIPGQASIIAGSWSINQVIGNQPLNDPNVFMVTQFGSDQFIGLDASATSAANLEWYVREILESHGGSDAPFDYCNSRVGQVEPSFDDPMFHPFLYGSAEGGEYRANFFGLAGWHSDAHLIRAIYEGVAFEHRRHIGVLTNSGINFETAMLSGGGTRSEGWSQMFADILGIPVSVVDCKETGALGGAMAAAIGVGLYGSFQEAASAMTRPARRHLPKLDMKSHYDARYALFRDLTEALVPFWRAAIRSKDTASA